VEYLEEENHGIVVLGLNRPKAMVKKYLSWVNKRAILV
jgi:hypothetical protein